MHPCATVTDTVASRSMSDRLARSDRLLRTGDFGVEATHFATSIRRLRVGAGWKTCLTVAVRTVLCSNADPGGVEKTAALGARFVR